MPLHSLFLHSACLVLVDRRACNAGRICTRRVAVATWSATESEDEQPPVEHAPDSPVLRPRRKRALVLQPSDDEESPKRACFDDSPVALQQPSPAADSPQPGPSGAGPSFERAASPEPRLNRRDRRFRRRQTPPPQPLFDSSSDD